MPNARFGIILPKSYPHKFISVYLINSVYPHHLCVPAFIWVPTLSVYPHHLSSAMRAFPSYVVRSSRVYLYVLLANDEDSSKWLDSTSKMPHISS